MSEILPRGQAALGRQRVVSGSSEEAKGAPSCVLVGLARAWGTSPLRPSNGWVELRQAWRFGMACSKILQVNLKER